MELHLLQNQLKTVIQNHQIVISKMRNDPQNTVLQKQLHDLQIEIMALSEKQKQVVQQLRKQLEQKHHQVHPKQNTSPIKQPTVTSASNVPNQREICTVPQTSVRSVFSPSSLLGRCRSPVSSTPGCISITPSTAVVSHVTVSLMSSHTERHTPPTPTAGTGPPPTRPVPTQGKALHRGEHKKLEFMTALGLVTRDTLNELQSKRMERKRRTTANPQFSHAALEEKRRNAAFLNPDQVLGQPVKKPRGRPRLGSSSNTSDAGMNSVTCAITRTCSSSPSSSVITTAVTTSIPVASSTVDVTGGDSIVPNGFHPLRKLENSKAAGDSLELLCGVCQKVGDLIRCTLCKGPYHLSCIQSQVTSSTQVGWTCNKCQEIKKSPPTTPTTTTADTDWTGSLAISSSYKALKAAKEEEKRKLEKRCVELKLERSELEERVKHLNEVIFDQITRRKELQAAHQKVEESIERLQNFVQFVQQSS